ncbi:MAG: PilZ domain-containing protein [Acidobacteriota bacterium]
MSSPGKSAAAREQENSKLLVRWTDSQGISFSEGTQTHNISETGISFYLKAPMWLDTHLSLTIADSQLFGHLRTLTAKVVRVRTDAQGQQLVGARFDE